MHIEWGPKFQVHVKILDEQHKETIRLFNLLDDAAAQNSPHEVVAGIISLALRHLDFHIATEEHYFDEFRYEHADEHKAAHKNFLAEVKHLVLLDEDHPERILAEVMPVMKNWLEVHTAVHDKKYEQCFHEHGLDGKA